MFNRIIISKIFSVTLAVNCLATYAAIQEQTTQTIDVFEYQNPISNGIRPMGIRDSQIFKDGNTWYMTGTDVPFWQTEKNKADVLFEGVPLYKSENLLDWEFLDHIIKRPSKDKWFYRPFWAAEIHKINGKYYAVFSSANRDKNIGLSVGYAVANSVEGPYTMVTNDKPLTNGNDLSFFVDDDSKVWAFWNRGQAFGIGFAQVDLDTATFLTEPKSAIRPGDISYVHDENGTVVMETIGKESVVGSGREKKKVDKFHHWDSEGIEGAYVIKRNDIYYLFYSSWTRGYEIGYATSRKITGPWTKADHNPIYGSQNKSVLKKKGMEFTGDPDNPFQAVGHNEVFIGPDGRHWLSAHGIIKGQSPFLVIDPINFDTNGKITVDGPTYTKQTIPLNE
ncbi:glycoside hydrolase family 43 protein [Echinimonas agarilytica]|uniref:Family 43 glycosylhydrolase n=1 Tax=Echinimonas agarilytica TaxID=1215918 RepID=A0AA41W4L7_9GAMM|nr:family 43 glycosylhydrolase [Echinimonas agarilytica]MCM2678648.1 family 43 glycosylhydrolase [Echinimonas agarilytica]